MQTGFVTLLIESSTYISVAKPSMLGIVGLFVKSLQFPLKVDLLSHSFIFALVSGKNGAIKLDINLMLSHKNRLYHYLLYRYRTLRFPYSTRFVYICILFCIQQLHLLLLSIVVEPLSIFQQISGCGLSIYQIHFLPYQTHYHLPLCMSPS